MPQNQQNEPKPIIITNFAGRLTRILNGDLNSGFAKFAPSWGYDPFSKPMNLTWLEQPTDIRTLGASSIIGTILTAKTRFEGGTQYIYAVDHTGTLYKIQSNSGTSGAINPNVDKASILSVLSNVANNLNFGGSMEFFGTSEKIYLGYDNGIEKVNTDGSGETIVASSSVLQNTYHPLKQFAGNLMFGNGNTIAKISGTTGTVTSSVIGTGNGNLYSELNPLLPVETRVQELDVSVDGNYLLVAGSNITPENIMTTGNDRVAAAGTDSAIYRWNGSDVTITALQSIPSYATTAMHTYLGNQMFFSNDSFGASLNDGTNKILTLPMNKSPLPNSTAGNGNFLTWITPEVTGTPSNSSVVGTNIQASLYYFGALDQENQPGLYRLMRYPTTITNGVMYQTPLNILTNNKYATTNTSASNTSILSLGYGKHYFSTFEIGPGNPSSVYGFYRFLVTPSGTGTPQAGVYETQTQLFSQRVTIKQIRVYTEPTASGNGFQIDCIGSDGNVITNGTFTYTYAAGSDPTLLQGSLERINFNPASMNTYALGLRITNTGTTNMTIKKIEIDPVPSGK